MQANTPAEDVSYKQTEGHENHHPVLSCTSAILAITDYYLTNKCLLKIYRVLSIGMKRGNFAQNLLFQNHINTD